MNRESSDYLANAVEQCLGDGTPRIVFDMSEISLIDSAGLEKLLDLDELVESRAGVMKLAAPNPLCRDILSVSGLVDHFEIHKEVKIAVGSFIN